MDHQAEFDERIKNSFYREEHAREDAPRERCREERHRDIMWVLHRLATAIEHGNDLTDRVVNKT